MKFRSIWFLGFAGVIFPLIPTHHCLAQFAGSSAGAKNDRVVNNDFDVPEMSVSEARIIKVDGTAEIRVQPTEIRMVLAAVSEGRSANECKDQSVELVAKILAGWKQIGIDEQNSFEDFIAILPVYRFEEQTQNNLTVLREVLDGYRYQTNLHVKLTDNQQARKALQVAFTYNVTDIIAFDYWHPDLDAIKTQALKKALEAARAKSDILFDPKLFEQPPKLFNLRESHRTIFPADMYQTFTNTVDQVVNLPYRYREDVPRISAPRPKTTYYRGLVLEGDSMSSELAMKPEISVVAKVRLYFESPFVGRPVEKDDDVQSRHHRNPDWLLTNLKRPAK